MTILLDLDGVLVTTPTWRTVELEADGFFKFDERAAKNLAFIVDETQAAIVLTTSHRINYSVEEWKELLKSRGIFPSSISKVNAIATIENIADRASEIEEWVRQRSNQESYVIIDDDLSINRLPKAIKDRFVQTMPLIGLDDAATNKALNILRHGPK